MIMSKNINVTESPMSGNVNRIYEGTEIRGSIKAPTDYRIDGKIEGDIKCEGKVIVGEKGFIKGEVISKNMEISGKVEGSISIESILTLKATSVVNGDVLADKVFIELGAQFSGTMKMPNNNSNKSSHSDKRPDALISK